MFMFDKDWSIKHMYEELERWVQFKRRQADRVSELPMVRACLSRRGWITSMGLCTG